MKRVFSSDLFILANLISKKAIQLVVYDPSLRLVQNDTTKVFVEDTLINLENRLESIVAEDRCLVNLSGQKIPFLNADYFVEFELNSSYSNKIKLKWNYISNPDQTIRWLYPKQISKPWFLEFYNADTKKARFYKWLTRLAFSFRFNSLLRSGYLCIYSAQPINAEVLLRSSSRPNYSIFTGTVGLNRKIILADAAKGRVTAFIKIPLNEISEENLHNEAISVRVMKGFNIPNLELPKMLFLNNKAVLLKNVKFRNSVILSEITGVQLDFFSHLYKVNMQVFPLHELRFLKHIKRTLVQIESRMVTSKMEKATLLFQLLQKNLEKLEKNNNRLVPTSMMHGDFTPWNMYLSGNLLSVYDWELAKPNMPLLFDAFHFVIQSKVLIHHSELSEIKKELNRVAQLKSVLMLLSNYNIDFNFHLNLYLLYVSTYYLDIYMDQSSLHEQAHWLVEAWIGLLNENVDIKFNVG